MASKERQINRWLNIESSFPTFITCLICNYYGKSEEYKKYISNDIFNAGEIVRHSCPSCNLIFGDLRVLNLSSEEIKNDYEDTYSYYAESETRYFILDSLNSLDIFKNKELSYLDYGCGIGTMIPILTNMGYNITGFDKFVKHENIINNIENLMFDVIYCNNLIEHLLSPIEDIKDILKNLKKNGYLIFISDCLDEYKVEFTHFHTFYYTGNSLNLLIEKLNLTKIELKDVGPSRVLVLQN
uniref:Methyltransferase n=1 Tax=viral metagenome TaxID=1070528 RepID=A0A6C0AZN2_9ZZZZ